MSVKTKLPNPNYEGLMLIPIEYGTRKPTVKWKSAQTEFTHHKADAWGWGTITGEISGNLECIDVDLKVLKDEDERHDVWTTFKKMVSDNQPDLLAKITIQQTQNNGYHLFYRCKDLEIPGNQVLSRHESRKAIFETRGEGGYVMVFPSDGYKVIQGDLNSIQSISSEERKILMDCAKAFNRFVVEQKEEVKDNVANPDSPWAQFNEEGDPLPILKKHGWTIKTKRSDGAYELVRPGKTDDGISATWNNEGKRYFYVFSSNAHPFEPETAYRASEVFATLECGGNWSVTASKLKALGYVGNEQKSKIDKLNNQFEVQSEIMDKSVWMKGIFTLDKFKQVKPITEEQLIKISIYNQNKGREEHFSVLTKGNIFTLVANQGFGKTSIMASIASQVFRNGEERDSIHKLHFKLDDNATRILYFDSELKIRNAAQHFKAMARRLGASKDEANWEAQKLIDSDKLTYFQSMTLLTEYPELYLDSKQLIEQMLDDAKAEGKPYSLVIIDDASCLVEHEAESTNNIDASKKACQWLNLMAYSYDIGFICTIHGNASDTEGTGKGRGHLGSELARWSESVLNLSMNRKEELYKILIGLTGKMREGGIFSLSKYPLWYYYDDDYGFLMQKPNDFQPDSEEEKEARKQERAIKNQEKREERIEQKKKDKEGIAEKINDDIRSILKQSGQVDSKKVKQILENYFRSYSQKSISKLYTEWKECYSDEFSVISQNGFADTIKFKTPPKAVIVKPAQQTMSDEIKRMESSDDFDNMFNED
jgi:hypothetical protein